MIFNLITDAWLPVRRLSGVCASLSPSDLTSEFSEDPLVALDFPRPDWNAAVTEWLIGITFLALRPDGVDEWADRFREPPRTDTLTAAFAPLAFAFDLDGEGVRAFQDFDGLSNAAPKSLSGLLMDAPGENTLKNNADLFIKRGGADALCLPFAAAALITLQTYAPSGGAGHRTSLRGGGPLTTLVAPRRKGEPEAQTLWDRVWANVPDADFDLDAPGPGTPAGATQWARVFPWLAPTRTSQNDRPVTPESVSMAQAFFACPRRIRLSFSADEHACGLGGKTGRVATGMATINYGANYIGWTHPLSPYRQDKKSGMLPLHPHSGASDYGDCTAWWGLEGEAAASLRLWVNRQHEVDDLIGASGVEAFGFDMDNMKARQWLEVRLPWAPVYGASGRDLKVLLTEVIAASDEAARALRYTVKLSLFGQRQRAGGYKLPETLPRDALPEPAERLWRQTDGAFRAQVDALIAATGDAEGIESVRVKEEWLRLLQRTAFSLFADAVDLDGLTDSNPHRLLTARAGLARALARSGAVAKALRIDIPAKPRAKKEST
jgi:CRISPR system Cascade subunit CasA